MQSVRVTNPEVDQKVAEMVTTTFETMTSHWRAILPPITVTIVLEPFNCIPELREFCEMQNSQPGWEKSNWRFTQVVCPESSEKSAVLYVYFDRQSNMGDQEYYFQKKLYSVLAQLMWSVSSILRQEIKRHVTGMAQASEGAVYLAFRDSFSRFFLNPEYLQERKQAAWSFMKRLDESLALVAS